ncbi:thioredoxin family protein [Haliscomenobacter hydrossis]|uniref:Alkyl hydroperoxide reductase/ Thiol specific antioxidant/ Mal allergen n=1 Tax=Haliscomenobacter hydrossis (strain ATCC 27775 / DSM 1100 / LMG 10767 / O) TaxID=760192 RepID=F4KYY5_HALH1|nr:thioredoxin family protein [Haliscomenobacter hydrossis]AEE52672.1 alkyl hydroperoxide reductase/ Thiol specific antioxidant/ Mal allergen [Haliscomenobacter hydrossis DSM 1100]
MKTKTGLGIGFFASVLFLLFSFPNLPTVAGLKVGDIAPDFQLKSTSGKMVTLKDYKSAKGYIVIFTCNTCPYAQAYEQRIIDLHNKMEPMGWPVVAIMPNDPSVQPGDGFDRMTERAKQQKYPFEYLLDEGQKVFPAYGAARTPHVFLLDKDRKVRYIGAIDDNADDESLITRRYVEEAIAAVEKGNEPDPNLTKAVGCMIKVKK